MRAALWALDHDVAAVIANGFAQHSITDVVEGKRVGTFFTKASTDGPSVELQAISGACAYMQQLCVCSQFTCTYEYMNDSLVTNRLHYTMLNKHYALLMLYLKLCVISRPTCMRS